MSSTPQPLFPLKTRYSLCRTGCALSSVWTETSPSRFDTWTVQPVASRERRLFRNIFIKTAFVSLLQLSMAARGSSDSCKLNAPISMGCFVTFWQSRAGGSKIHEIVPNMNYGHGVPPGLFEIKNIRTSGTVAKILGVSGVTRIYFYEGRKKWV